MSDGERAIVLTRNRVYELAVRTVRADVRRLSREGMTLLPTQTDEGGAIATSPLSLRPLDASVPPGAQTVAVSGGELLVGTRSLGTARLSLERRGASSGDSRWLRREELAEGASLLTVDCELESDCRLANGSGELWRFDGERFVRRSAASATLGVVDVAGDAVAVLARNDHSIAELVAAPSTGELADQVVLASVRIPDGYELRRLRSGRGRSVLLGWAHAGAARDAPLALAHWIRLDGGQGRTLGSGGAPLFDIVACGGRIFAATGDGIDDLTAAQPVRISELRVQRLECDREQLVAASDTAIVRRSAGTWTDVVSLTQPVRDFAIAADGRVFLADAAGLGLWDGDRVRRYDVRRGLLENDLREIALDRFGRIWIRGASGVGLFRL